MKKKYKDLIDIGYPLSNVAYVIAVNNHVLENEGLAANNHVNVDTGLEPETLVILEAAGLFNKANKGIR